LKTFSQDMEVNNSPVCRHAEQLEALGAVVGLS
jgi:hypothetical protein